MLPQITVSKLDDYFLPRSKRNQNGIYFQYVVGHSKEAMEFLSHYYYETKKNGVYFKDGLPNPEGSQVNTFFEVAGTQFAFQKEMIKNAVSKWFQVLTLEKQNCIAEAVFSKLSELSAQGNNENILKNAYVKFMCWLRYKCNSILARIGEENPPKILYEGDIGKYEYYFLQILAYAGCDVLLLHFQTEEGFQKYGDRTKKQSQLILLPARGIPGIHFTQMDWGEKEKITQEKEKFQAFDNIIETNRWIVDEYRTAAFRNNKQRGSNQKKIYNLFIKEIGVSDTEQFENQLFHWKMKLEEQGKKVFVVEESMQRPNTDEVNKIKMPKSNQPKELIYELSNNIMLSKDQTLNTLIKKAFVEMMEKEDLSNPAKVKNQAICIVCWLNRYGSKLYDNMQVTELPMFLFFGACNHNEGVFLELLAKTPVDVVLICTNKEKNCELNSKDAQELILDYSVSVKEFPKKEKRIQVATTAYSAERELDRLMYQDTGLYRNYQYIRSAPVTLRTTYEEIDILWNEEAKFRPSFDTMEHQVVVPAIFAKISGVKNGDIEGYWQSIRSKVTANTIIIERVPHIKGTDANPIKPDAATFCRNRKLDIAKIKSHRAYPYDYLPDEVQDFLLDKIQELIDLEWITANTQGIEYAIISTLLNLDKETVRLIQKFDFTKEIPKLIVVSTKEELCSLEDSIYIAFLNLIGFDILIYTPTGYRTVGKFLKQGIFEEHQIGEYMFDLRVEQAHLRNAKNAKENNRSTGVFGRLFGKGRN